ncbi:hypothetical protein BFF48_24335 [Shigella sp. FC1882]|nr:hypothetical protein BFF48_24335 [Shigella sp. FC1882]
MGGIVANNTYPADFIYQNMMIESNLLDSRAVHDFFASERIDQVYLAAAKDGRHCCQQHLSGGFHLPEHDD